ncbi:protein FANTASTIC FOUR 3-like [Lycium ferocissimum]|uniref:protein FANTASTIC FOUR 3-like n=1 Tax=Lycium ferocissimum TaxID=112874 RepID=UPI002814A88A|nr:protein FANTASTIC FOUR 3-like [Lycium ferocissimum]
MSIIVYQDLQSCCESHIIETTTLNLKVPTPTPIVETTLPHLQSNLENITNEKCWSSLQSLSTNSKEKENTYVHPLSKRHSSSSRLSEKSLALCTENLGSETGTDQTIESSIFSFSSHESKTEKSPTLIPKTDTQVESPSSNYSKVITHNTESCRKLPPPLTTLRGSNSLHVRPHREGGRLVIEAVEAPKMRTYFQAERSNGRLRLCFFNDGSSASNFGMETTDEEKEELKVENDVFESENNDEEEEEEEEREDEEEEEENGMYMKQDMDGNSYDVEAEIGIVNCQRVRRCKEGRQGNKTFCDWRNPLWVATS